MAPGNVVKEKSSSPTGRRNLLDLPVSSRFDWDTVQIVYAALQQHDEGIFRSSAVLMDAMLRDDRLRGVMSTRLNALLGLPMQFADSDAQGQPAEIADDLRRNWERMFPRAELSEILRWGHTLNAGVGQLVWSLEKEKWVPKLKHWHPQYLIWRWDTRSYWISTMEDGMVEVVPGDGTWVLYTPHGYQRGWIHGLVRSLALPWIIRRWCYRDWSRYSEVHGLPIKKAVMPIGAEKKTKDQFMDEVIALGIESAVRVEKDKDGYGFDVELLEAEANTWEGFDRLITQANDSMAVTVLGQNLTTETRAGSLAAAKVQENVRADYLKFDATSLSQALREQALKPWAEFNYGSDELAPELPGERSSYWVTEPPEDKAANADALQKLGAGVTALKAAGANVDLEEICERFDVPLVEGQPLKEPPAPALMPGAPGAPRPAGGGGLRQAEQRSTRPAPHIQGQLYVDELGDHAREDGKEALAVDLRAVLDVVERADSYEQLRQGLISAFGQMSPRKLARLVEKAIVLAELRGRASVLQGL